MKTVHTTTDPQEAALLQAMLRAEGIESALGNEHSGSLAVGFSTWAVPLLISVADPDAERATDLIRQNVGPRDPDVAPAADDLDKGMVSVSCPCGKALDIPEELKGTSVDCPWCGRAVTAR